VTIWEKPEGFPDVEMLRYLVEDYWGRRSGWPDLFIFRDDEFFFAEASSLSTTGMSPGCLL
jgi:hypothetical protein